MSKTFPLLFLLVLAALAFAGCSTSAAPATAAPTAAAPVAATEDPTQTLNNLATSVAVIQNPPTAAPVTATTAPVAGNLPDPCTLLPQTDVNAATGVQFDAPKSQPTLPEFLGADGTPVICKYDNGDKQVSLLVLQGTRPYTTQKGLTDFQKTLQPVTGLGDEAFWDSASNSLWVLKGNLVLTLEFDRMDKASSAMGQTLMQKALSRLN